MTHVDAYLSLDAKHYMIVDFEKTMLKQGVGIQKNTQEGVVIDEGMITTFMNLIDVNTGLMCGIVTFIEESEEPYDGYIEERGGLRLIIKSFMDRNVL